MSVAFWGYLKNTGGEWLETYKVKGGASRVVAFLARVEWQSNASQDLVCMVSKQSLTHSTHFSIILQTTV